MSAMRQREVLSPIVSTPNIPQRYSQSSVNSPSFGKVNSVSSPSTLLMEQQDDELERKARRRSRVMDLQRKNMGSPSSPADRRKSLPLSGFSTAQLTEHYTSCIKLSAENKINAKNAFGLHLIDYMSELLKKKELENFQVASTTLDASAKIYAGRVDAIHAETYKVLSGLGRGADKHKHAHDEDTLEGEDGGAEGEARPDEAQKKKKKRKSKTVETNLKNINVNKFDLEFEVDPLFQVMSAAFDEGGSSGLLLSNLRTFDNTQRLVLDSNTLISPTDDLDMSRIEERKENVDVTDFKGLLTDNTTAEKLVCPAFSTYRFTNWDSSDQSSIPGITASQEEHRFDMDAEPEPIPDHHDDMSVLGGGDGSFLGDDLEDVADTNLDEEIGRDNCIGDGKAAQLVQSVLSDMTHGTTGALMQVLSMEPSDYSYFNKALLRTWAGPSHWRAGHLSRELGKSASTTQAQKSKGKKQVFRIDFDEEIDFESKFKISKATALTKNTLNKYSKDQTTLPKDHHYDADKLFRLFMLKRRMIKREKTSANVDDAIENYDYENANDRENYCPNDEGDDDNDSGDMDFGNFVAAGTDFSQESSSSQDPFSQSQDTFTQPNLGDGTILTGDKLLAQPYKVAKIDIDYAKTAKKLDVKRLKSSMWNLMKAAPKDPEQPSEDGNTNNSASNEPGTSKEMEGKLTFQKLLNDLPEKVSGQTARNLSVPIAFVCLLHLANEKTLKIEDCSNMEDLTISQGL
ncbi:condensin complex subunit 2-like [Ruditapes philippinarum]|uniref:condensin complex subunit 2-like n=1 Tax=Ruditapes philippinarum TaxID=129788 RepID=UPI00295C34E9|nr:condensin complex subunit 2-like [Ruditapes philippinarum]XP_060588426.1 condensin complex subunit 2-like [Ruditapes philippinarum]